MSATAWMWTAWGGIAGVAGAYGWAWRRCGKRGRAWLEWGLVMLVAGVSAASVATHEPWADELHAWLKTRELGLGALWTEMAYEGHFMTWYVILHPFARSGAPVETMGWISWAINAVAVAWFARKAPLGGWAKAAMGLSCVFLYVNPAISRPYVLVPPVLFGLAALWNKRDARPVAFGALAALLANTHVCMEGTAGALFLVYAWENVLHRKDGKGWRQCGRQWAGLGTMVAGFAVAVWQLLPSLWKTSLALGNRRTGLAANAWYFAMGCTPKVGVWLVVGGLFVLAVAAWRWDKGVFWMCAGTWLWMMCLSMFVWPANIINRALAWWPVMLGGGWVLAGETRRSKVAGLAVAAMGLGLMRPDTMWQDWRVEYDRMPGACHHVATRYGRDAEVWIDGQNYLCEGAAAYLTNLMDWQTGEKAELVRFKAGQESQGRLFEERVEEILRARPEQESLLVLALFDQGSGCKFQIADSAGIVMEYGPGPSMNPIGPVVLKVGRSHPRDRGMFWGRQGMARYGAGDRAGAMEAWKRAVAEDGGAWKAMNNLAWVSAEEGRVAEARAWIDRAMEFEEARTNAGVRDTEAAVRKVERFAAGKAE